MFISGKFVFPEVESRVTTRPFRVTAVNICNRVFSHQICDKMIKSACSKFLLIYEYIMTENYDLK